MNILMLLSGQQQQQQQQREHTRSMMDSIRSSRASVSFSVPYSLLESEAQTPVSPLATSTLVAAGTPVCMSDSRVSKPSVRRHSASSNPGEPDGDVHIFCAFCGATSETLLSCQCRAAVYCDARCQELDWHVHCKACTRYPRCASCGVAWDVPILYNCTCRAVVYCSTDCQAKAWPRHKQTCKARRDAKKSGEAAVSQEITSLLRHEGNAFAKATRGRTRSSIVAENARLKEALAKLGLLQPSTGFDAFVNDTLVPDTPQTLTQTPQTLTQTQGSTRGGDSSESVAHTS